MASKVYNDNIQLNAPKAIDNKTGKFVAGVWVPFDTIGEAQTTVRLEYRHQNLFQFILKEGVSTAYIYRDGIADDQLIEWIGTSSGGDATWSTDFTAQLGSDHVGGVVTGQFYAQGSSLEQSLRDAFTKVQHPDYNAPTLVLSSDDTDYIQEAGTIINPVFDVTFNQNDAGTLISEELDRDSTLLSTGFPYTDANFQIIDGATDYSVTVDYAAGPVKNDNLGNPDTTGQIEAGEIVSNHVTYIGYRNAFWDAIITDVPTDSTGVRALTNTLLNPSGQDFIIDIPVGTVNVVFALPNSLTLSYVQYIELSNSDIKAAFVITSVSVEGANAFDPIAYNVYAYTPVEPFTVEVHYRVKAVTAA